MEFLEGDTYMVMIHDVHTKLKNEDSDVNMVM